MGPNAADAAAPVPPVGGGGPATLAAALVELQARLPRIVKDTPGQFGKYANLASIHETVMPLLAALGLFWICTPTLNSDGQFILAYALGHTSGVGTVNGEYPLGQGTAQQLGSAITYARRYTLCAVLGLVADDDDDGQAATDAWRPPANPRTRKADRHSAARSGPLPDDDWTTGPPDEAPGSISGARVTELRYWFAKNGITKQAEQLVWTMNALPEVGEIESSGELSEAQGIALVAKLKEEAGR